MKKAKTLVTIVTTVMSGRTALARLKQARADGDHLELIDAFLNAVVLITGTIIIVRRMRRGEVEA